MNRLQGTIEQIQVSGHLSRVRVMLPGGVRLQAIVIDTPDTAAYLAGQGPIGVLFKETEVILSLEDRASTSVENRLKGCIEHLEEGELLSRITLRSEEGPITAVVAAGAVKRLGLRTGTEVTALIPMNEIMLTEA